MGTDPQNIAQRAALAGAKGLPFLSQRARASVALRLDRLRRLDQEQRALVADLLDLIVVDLRDNAPNAERAKIVATLADALALFHDAPPDTAPRTRKEVKE